MPLLESGEMYLETILILSQKIKNVRAIDVGGYMGYSKPSVSRAMGLLKSGGFITVDSDGYITLTQEGMQVATTIYERHIVLSKFLMELGVDEETATDDACKIEHDISDKSFKAIKKYMAENNL